MYLRIEKKDQNASEDEQIHESERKFYVNEIQTILGHINYL